MSVKIDPKLEIDLYSLQFRMEGHEVSRRDAISYILSNFSPKRSSGSGIISFKVGDSQYTDNCVNRYEVYVDAKLGDGNQLSISLCDNKVYILLIDPNGVVIRGVTFAI